MARVQESKPEHQLVQASQETKGNNASSLAPPAFQLAAEPIQAKKEEEEKSDAGPAVQKKAAGPVAAPPAGGGGNKGGLPGEVQSQMESSIGADFSNVNIHTDSNQASNIGALAFTKGNDVHFAPGQYKPDTQSGQELIGHELTHVKQQQQGRVKPTGQTGGMALNDDKGLEAEADQMGKTAAQTKMAPGKTSGAGTGKSASGPAQMKSENDDPLKVDRGQLTFDVEGNDNANSRYFSRVIHWPAGNSGVTIGRGFDLGARGKEANLGHLHSAGITGSQADLLASASRLKGKPAGEWVQKNKDKVGEITHDQQKLLFEIVYEAHKQDVIRISSKKDVVELYGATNFDEQHPAITDVLVDLRYRGDYHSRSRRYIQKAAADNDLKKFAELMSNEKWKTDFGVPKHRFDARKKYINDALNGNKTTLNTDGPTDQKSNASGGGQTTAGDQGGGVGAPTGAGTVTANSLNVRSGPGTNNPKVGTALKKGAEVTIYGGENGWYQIGQGQWVSGKYIEKSAAKTEDAGTSGGAATAEATLGKGTVLPNGLNVRSGPGSKNKKVGSPLKQGETVTLYEEKNGWYRIGDGKWVFGKYLSCYCEMPDQVSSADTSTSSESTQEQTPATSEGGSTEKEEKETASTGSSNQTTDKKDAEETGMVTASSLNVRKGPGGNFDKVGDALTSGSKVTIFEEQNGWYRIGKDQWVSGKYVRIGSLIPDNAGGKPNWLSIAEGEIGTREIKGEKHNSRVLEYHSTTGKFGTDEVPWCASFVNWVFGKAGVTATGSALALSFKSWGTKLEKPAYGAVAVFSHGGGKGHVGFVVGKQGDKLLVLGGNQSNMVKVSAYNTSKVVAYVVPSDYEVPGDAYTLLGMDDELKEEGYAQTR